MVFGVGAEHGPGWGWRRAPLREVSEPVAQLPGRAHLRPGHAVAHRIARSRARGRRRSVLEVERSGEWVGALVVLVVRREHELHAEAIEERHELLAQCDVGRVRVAVREARNVHVRDDPALAAGPCRVYVVLDPRQLCARQCRRLRHGEDRDEVHVADVERVSAPVVVTNRRGEALRPRVVALTEQHVMVAVGRHDRGLPEDILLLPEPLGLGLFERTEALVGAEVRVVPARQHEQRVHGRNLLDALAGARGEAVGAPLQPGVGIENRVECRVTTDGWCRPEGAHRAPAAAVTGCLVLVRAARLQAGERDLPLDAGGEAHDVGTRQLRPGAGSERPVEHDPRTARELMPAHRHGRRRVAGPGEVDLLRDLGRHCRLVQR